jgi:hypothetical protein
MSITCHFCNQNAEFKPLKEMSLLNVDVYFCFKCNAEYLVWGNGNLGAVSLYTMIKNKMYRWSNNLMGTMTLSYVIEPGIPGEKANKLEHLLVLTEHKTKGITINPTNIVEKISNYLLFL